MADTLVVPSEPAPAGRAPAMAGRVELRNGLALSRTPLRISFAGGGSDCDAFYRQVMPGAVLSAAIDKYVYVMVKRHGPLFNEHIRLNYSETELVASIGRIRNDIARACLERLGCDGPLYISTVADVPAASGLGSSSSFAVGLLQALHAMKGERVSAGQLAEEACAVEIEMLGKPIGKQDQFAAAYGGLNYMVFQPDGDVAVSPVRLPAARVAELFRHLLLFWTGQSRQSASILAEQQENVRSGDQVEHLVRIRGMADELHAHLTAGFDPWVVGRLLDESWELKRRLASGVTSAWIDEQYRRARAAGALGGKLCGAGGGGFLMFIVEPGKRAAVCTALQELRAAEVGFETGGSRLLFPHD